MTDNWDALLNDEDLLTDPHGGEMAERDLAEHGLEKMPPWAPEYLACWGSKAPHGGRMTVTFAAEFAGTTPDNVRQYRKANRHFRRLEQIARYAAGAWSSSYIEAGLRALAPGLMRALAAQIEAGNTQTVLKVAEWLRGKPVQHWNIDLTQLTEEQLERIANGDDPLTVLTDTR